MNRKGVKNNKNHSILFTVLVLDIEVYIQTVRQINKYIEIGGER